MFAAPAEGTWRGRAKPIAHGPACVLQGEKRTLAPEAVLPRPEHDDRPVAKSDLLLAVRSADAAAGREMWGDGLPFHHYDINPRPVVADFDVDLPAFVIGA